MRGWFERFVGSLLLCSLAALGVTMLFDLSGQGLMAVFTTAAATFWFVLQAEPDLSVDGGHA